MKTTVLYKILWVLVIAGVVIVTFKFIKVLPALMKVLALAANVITVYFAINYFKQNKKEK
jgi:hypothetical protein